MREPFFYSLRVGHRTCLFPFFLPLKKKWYGNKAFLSWYAVKDKPYRTTVETAPHKCLKIIFVLNCILYIYQVSLARFWASVPISTSCPNNTYGFLKCCNSRGKSILSIGSQAIPVLHSKGKGILAIGSQEIPTVLFPRGNIPHRNVVVVLLSGESHCSSALLCQGSFPAEM